MEHLVRLILGGLGTVILAITTVVLFAAVAGHLSTQVPIDRLCKYWPMLDGCQQIKPSPTSTQKER